MDSNRPRVSDQPMQPASFGIGGDLRRLKSEGTASIAELKEFLGKMRGRSPQEVLGQIAQSSLVQCTIWATLLTAVFMAAFTLGPYYLRDPKAAAKPAKPKAAAAQAAAAPSATASAPASKATPSTEEAPERSNVEKAAEKMKMNETKVADPKKNPLDGDLDKLLEIKD